MSSRVLLAFVLLAACDRGAELATSPAPMPAQTPTKPAEPPPVTPPAAPVTPPAVDLYTSSDGLVAGPRPPGDGWECVEQVAKEPGQETTLIKCRHTDRAQFFFLMAKDYAVPPEQVRGAEELATRVFPTTYQKLFQSHVITDAHAVELAGRPGHEIWVEAVHASMGPIRKRERVFTHGNHVFVLSAEGKPEVFDRETAAIEAWFSGARFKNLP